MDNDLLSWSLLAKVATRASIVFGLFVSMINFFVYLRLELIIGSTLDSSPIDLLSTLWPSIQVHFLRRLPTSMPSIMPT